MSEVAKEVTTAVDPGSNLDRLIASILDRAKAQAAEIMTEAKRQADAVVAAAEPQGARLANEIKAEAERKATEERARVLGAARRQAVEAKLSAKADVLQKAADYVCERLAKADPVGYERLLEHLLLTAVQTGDEVVRWAQADHQLRGAKITAAVNTALKSQGRAGQLSVGEPFASEYQGGFLVIGHNYEVNATVNVLIELFFDDHEAEIAKILFGEL